MDRDVPARPNDMSRQHQHTLGEFVDGSDRQQGIDAAAARLRDSLTQPDQTRAPRVAFDGVAVVETQPNALTFVDEARRPVRPAVVDWDRPAAVQVATRCNAVAASTGERCNNDRMHDTDLCASHRRSEGVTRWYEHQA